MFAVSTKQKLLSLIDDVELITKELLDVFSGKDPTLNAQNLIELLISKDKEIKNALKDADQQVIVQKKIDLLKADISKSDQQIIAVQRHLREAELLLKTALYYSRQKLDSMETAIANPVNPEEVIRYAHKISASHGAVAPENWTRGDVRRPYPTDEEMRRGFLGHVDDSGQFRMSVVEALAMFSQNNGGLNPTPPHAVSSGPYPPGSHTPSHVPPNTPPQASRQPGRPAGVSWAPTEFYHGPPPVPGVNVPMPPPNQPPPGTFATGMPGVNMVTSPGLVRPVGSSSGSLLPPGIHQGKGGTSPGLGSEHNVELMSTESSSLSSSSDDERAETMDAMDAL